MFENPKDDVRPGPLERAWQRAAQDDMAAEDDVGRTTRRAAVLAQVAALQAGERQARTATPAANKPHWLLVSGSAFALVLCAGLAWRLTGDPADDAAVASAPMDGVKIAAQAPREASKDALPAAAQAKPEEAAQEAVPAAKGTSQKAAEAALKAAPQAAQAPRPQARRDAAEPAPAVLASARGQAEKAAPAQAEPAREHAAEQLAAAAPPPPSVHVPPPAGPAPAAPAAPMAAPATIDRADTRMAAARAAAKAAPQAETADAANADGSASTRRSEASGPPPAAAAAPLLRLARPAAPQAFPEPAWVDLIRRNDRAGLRAALAAGLDVNATDGGGRTPLMQAAIFARPEIMADLLARSASRRPVDHLGNTAATYAAQSADPRVRAALGPAERTAPGRPDE